MLSEMLVTNNQVEFSKVHKIKTRKDRSLKFEMGITLGVLFYGRKWVFRSLSVIRTSEQKVITPTDILGPNFFLPTVCTLDQYFK